MMAAVKELGKFLAGQEVFFAEMQTKEDSWARQQVLYETKLQELQEQQDHTLQKKSEIELHLAALLSRPASVIVSASLAQCSNANPDTNAVSGKEQPLHAAQGVGSSPLQSEQSKSNNADKIRRLEKQLEEMKIKSMAFEQERYVRQGAFKDFELKRKQVWCILLVYVCVCDGIASTKYIYLIFLYTYYSCFYYTIYIDIYTYIFVCLHITHTRPKRVSSQHTSKSAPSSWRKSQGASRYPTLICLH